MFRSTFVCVCSCHIIMICKVPINYLTICCLFLAGSLYEVSGQMVNQPTLTCLK